MDFVKRPVAIFCFGFTAAFCVIMALDGIPRVAVLASSLAVFAAFAALSFIRHRKIRMFSRRTAIAAGGVVLAAIFALAVFIPSMERYSYLDGKNAEIRGTVMRMLWESYDEKCYVLDASSVDGRDDSLNIALITESDLEPGDEISAKCLINKVEPDEDFDSVRYYLSMGITRTASRDRVLITGKSSSLRIEAEKLSNKVSERLKGGMSDGSGGLAAAVLLGDRTGLLPLYKRDFSRIGISHLIAISGMHVSFIAAALFFILKKLRAARRLSLIIIIITLIFYMFLTGFTPSVVRAAAVCCFMCLISLAGISYDGISALSVCGAAMLAADPYLSFSAAMIMSYTACIGCFAASSVIKKLGISSGRNDGFFRRIKSGIVKGALFTVSVVIFTLPVTLIYYDRTSLIAPFSNLIFIPLFSVILYLGALCAIFIPIPPLFSALCFITDAFCSAVAFAAGKLSGIRGITVPLNYSFAPYFAIVLSAALIACAVIKKKYFKYAASVLLVCAAGYLITVYSCRADFASSVKLVRSGNDKADSVIVTSDKEALLVDTACGNYKAFSKGVLALSKLHFTELDALVVSDYSVNSLLRLDGMLDSLFIDKVYLLAPLEDDEGFNTARDILSDKETEYEITDCLPGALRFNSAELSFVRCLDGGGTKSAVCVKVEGGSSSAIYLCDGWTVRRSSAPALFKDYSYVVFGATDGTPEKNYSAIMPYKFEKIYSFTHGAHLGGVAPVEYPDPAEPFIIDLG